MTERKNGVKGFELEDNLRIYFREAGYFVVRGVPYRLNNEDVTDIDLWLYERPAAVSTRRRLIVDIKNRKTPQAAERIIWTSGLRAALRVDGAIVATTDQRLATKRLAKSLRITLFDGEAIARLASPGKDAKSNVVSSSDFDNAVKGIDEGRHDNIWRSHLQFARASLLSGIGIHSANLCLSTFSYFAEQAIIVHPDSTASYIATRLTYLTGALALINFDYMLAELAFTSLSERKKSITDGIRFGQSDTVAAIPIIRDAVGLAQKYAENGAAVARQIENGFFYEAEQIPAEIIADYLVDVTGTTTLFDVAQKLDMAATLRVLPTFDNLSLEEKIALGTLLDYAGVSREKFANAWTGAVAASREDPSRATTDEHSKDSDLQDAQKNLEMPGS